MTSHSRVQGEQRGGLEPSHMGYQYLMLGEEKPKRKQEKPCQKYRGGKTA